MKIIIFVNYFLFNTLNQQVKLFLFYEKKEKGGVSSLV